MRGLAEVYLSFGVIVEVAVLNSIAGLHVLEILRTKGTLRQFKRNEDGCICIGKGDRVGDLEAATGLL